MHRHCCRQVQRGTGRQQCRCIVKKAVSTVKKSSWGWANLSPETRRAELKRLIKEKFVASFWLLTSMYWWCTVTQTSSTFWPTRTQNFSGGCCPSALIFSSNCHDTFLSKLQINTAPHLLPRLPDGPFQRSFFDNKLLYIYSFPHTSYALSQFLA